MKANHLILDLWFESDSHVFEGNPNIAEKIIHPAIDLAERVVSYFSLAVSEVNFKEFEGGDEVAIYLVTGGNIIVHAYPSRRYITLDVYADYIVGDGDAPVFNPFLFNEWIQNHGKSLGIIDVRGMVYPRGVSPEEAGAVLDDK